MECVYLLKEEESAAGKFRFAGTALVPYRIGRETYIFLGVPLSN